MYGEYVRKLRDIFYFTQIEGSQVFSLNNFDGVDLLLHMKQNRNKLHINIFCLTNNSIFHFSDMQFTPGESRISLSSNDRDALLQFTGTQGIFNDDCSTL